MQTLYRALGGVALAAGLAGSSCVWAQETTTTIDTYSEVTDAPAAHAAVHKKVVHAAHHASAPVRHKPAHAIKVADRTSAPAAAPTESVSTVDRKTVIHRDADGTVSEYSREHRQDANGITTETHREVTPGPDAAASSPGDGQ